MVTEEGDQEVPEKRKSLRAPIIVLKVAEEDQTEHLFGYAKDISRTGLFIQSVNPRRTGERFGISFQIPNTDIRVRCRCEVVWSREYKRKVPQEPGYAIRFEDLADNMAKAIDEWVSEQG